MRGAGGCSALKSGLVEVTAYTSSLQRALNDYDKVLQLAPKQDADFLMQRAQLLNESARRLQHEPRWPQASSVVWRSSQPLGRSRWKAQLDSFPPSAIIPTGLRMNGTASSGNTRPACG